MLVAIAILILFVVVIFVGLITCVVFTEHQKLVKRVVKLELPNDCDEAIQRIKDAYDNR